MDDMNCEKRLAVCDKRMTEICRDIHDLEMRAVLNEKEFALLSQKFVLTLEDISKSLPKLTDVISSIEKTLTGLQSEIKESVQKTKELESKINDLTQKVCVINEESNFNIRLWLKENFPIILAFSALGFLISWLTKFL